MSVCHLHWLLLTFVQIIFSAAAAFYHAGEAVCDSCPAVVSAAFFQYALCGFPRISINDCLVCAFHVVARCIFGVWVLMVFPEVPDRFPHDHIALVFSFRSKPMMCFASHGYPFRLWTPAALSVSAIFLTQCRRPRRIVDVSNHCRLSGTISNSLSAVSFRPKSLLPTLIQPFSQRC